VKLCYVINQYPKVSHSFIRREILALEEQGADVLRISFRGFGEVLPDAQDQLEQQRTFYTLRHGAAGLGFALFRTLLVHPILFFRALGETWRLGRGIGLRKWVHSIYFAEACVAATEVRRFGAAHIHAHFGTNSAEVALLTSLLSGVPFSFTVHGAEEFERPVELKLAHKIHRAARVVGVSSFGRSQLYRWARRDDWSKIEVVHCGLDAMFMQPPENREPQRDTLVCVGRLCEQKGQLLLLEALRRVSDQGIPCRIVLAGDGPMRRAIEQRATELGVSDRLRITGWIDGAQVKREILQARAMVLPSFAEGLPVVIMEAMALGRPVISTYIAGIPELVLPGNNGWLVPAGDVEQLTTAIVSCLATDDNELLEMGRHGRDRALERHNVQTEAAKLLLMFQSVVRERQQRPIN
jgi:colanic acid/amylovoran biosynthesis glycosyltransferase